MFKTEPGKWAMIWSKYAKSVGTYLTPWVQYLNALDINIELGDDSNIFDIVVKVDVGEDPYQSNNCDRVFSQECNLEIHMSTHSGEKPH